MNEIKVVGKQKFMDKEITQLEGGFGENQRIISAKEVANIHSMELKEVNKSINRLIEKNRIKENIDYINILTWVNNLPMNLEQTFGVKQEYLSRTKSIFVLSERGYSKLIKSMDDDTSWDIMDKLIDEYFTMREVINSDEQLKAMYLLKAVESTGEESAMAIKCYSDIRIKEATKPLLDDISRKEEVIHKQEDDIQIKKDIIEGFTNDIDLYTKRSIVNRVIKKCTNGNYSGRYKEMYKCFKETFSIDLEARCKGYNLKQTKKKDQLSVIKYCEKFNHIDGLYEVACKLYHTEVQELLKELGKIVE